MKKSLKAQAIDDIRSRILSGEYAPGTDLSELSLCESLGMSRTPIREALLVLQNEGLIEIVANKGARVTKLERDDIIKLGQVREVLEVMVLRLSFNKISRDLLRDRLNDIESELQYVEQNPDFDIPSDRFSNTNRIHSDLLSAAKNEYLTKMYESIVSQITRVTALSRHARSYKRVLLEHKRIIESILNENQIEAETAIQEHIHEAIFSLLTRDYDIS